MTSQEKSEEEKSEEEKNEEEKSETETLIDALEIINEKTGGDDGVARILRTINNERPEEINPTQKEKIEKWISNSNDTRKVARLMVWYIATHRLGIETETTADISFPDKTDKSVEKVHNHQNISKFKEW